MKVIRTREIIESSEKLDVIILAFDILYSFYLSIFFPRDFHNELTELPLFEMLAV